jgi:hypothetical protein
MQGTSGEFALSANAVRISSTLDSTELLSESRCTNSTSEGK